MAIRRSRSSRWRMRSSWSNRLEGFRIGNFPAHVIEMHRWIVKWSSTFSSENSDSPSKIKQHETTRPIDCFSLLLSLQIPERSSRAMSSKTSAGRFLSSLDLSTMSSSFVRLVHWITSVWWPMIIMVNELRSNRSLHSRIHSLGKWDQVTGINSPLYRSHTELEDHEDWKNTVRLTRTFFSSRETTILVCRIRLFTTGWTTDVQHRRSI